MGDSTRLVRKLDEGLLRSQWLKRSPGREPRRTAPLWPAQGKRWAPSRPRQRMPKNPR